MHGSYIPRLLEKTLEQALDESPAVALLGPRQCGKSTLAKAVISGRPNTVFLDLERRSDVARLAEPELFFHAHANDLVCLDEIQRMPDIFQVLRSVIDDDRRNGRFLILGSASRELIRQSSESLAGRLMHLELSPFLLSEVARPRAGLQAYLLRGGFPPSLLAGSDAASMRWRQSFIRAFLERDIPQLGITIPASSIERLWRMCAHHHGQVLNLSQLGASLGVSHTTARAYIELLARTFMVRVQPPFLPSSAKRLVKSPKIYIRDTGILHALLDIETWDDLLGHPAFGHSWESMVIENVLAQMPGWRGSFYRTAKGAEIDLVLEKGKRRIAIECKASSAPAPTQGFWNALEDIGALEAWVVAPIEGSYPLARGVTVASLNACIKSLRESAG
jgi:predicted AAA+ superfamily ATPase